MFMLPFMIVDGGGLDCWPTEFRKEVAHRKKGTDGPVGATAEEISLLQEGRELLADMIDSVRRWDKESSRIEPFDREGE